MSNQDNPAAAAAPFKASGIGSPASNDASILIFGASGDLTSRKLVPAIYMLWKKDYLPPKVPIIGVARREKTDESFRADLRESLSKSIRGGVSEADWQAFSQRLFYVCSNLDESADFTPLRESVERIERQVGQTGAGTRVVYMATDPKLFLPAVESLSRANMIPPIDSPRRLRVVFEKPFGRLSDSTAGRNNFGSVAI